MSRLLLSFRVVAACILSLMLASSVWAQVSATWRSVGPGGGGAIQTSAVSPADPNLAVVTSDVGGIYRTTDGGQTWSLRNDNLVQPDQGSFQYSITNDTVF